MRAYRKGETSIKSSQQAEWAYKSRTYVGQIESVDPNNGVIKVHVQGIHESRNANIPLWGLHYDGYRSSWFRYMPEPGAFVKCSYGPRNELEVLGYEAVGDEVDPTSDDQTGASTPQVGGYATIRKQSMSVGLKVFRPIQQGEFDLRSAGGAGFYASRDGVMTLEAGPRTFSLDKTRNEAVGVAGLHVLGDNGVEVRFGDVKRLLPGRALESAVLPIPAAAVAPKEWSVKVGYPTPPLGVPALTFYSEQAGDIRDGLGAPVVGSFGMPLRYQRVAYDASGLVPTLTVETDALGNTRVFQAATAIAGYHIESAALGGISLVAPRLALGSKTATEPAVHGAVLATLLTTWAGIIGAAVGSLPPATPPLPTTAAGAALTTSLVGALGAVTPRMLSLRTFVE